MRSSIINHEMTYGQFTEKTKYIIGEVGYRMYIVGNRFYFRQTVQFDATL